MKEYKNIPDTAKQKADSEQALKAFKKLREIFQQQYPNGLTDEEIDQIIEEERTKKYLKIKSSH